MKEFVLTHRKFFSIFLAVYVMLGGLFGLYLIFSIINTDTGLGAYLMIIPIAALYLVSLLGGIFYFVGPQRWRFYFLAKLALCFQVIQLAVKGFSFLFYYGPYLALGVREDDGIVLKFESLGLSFNATLGEVEIQGVMINLVPILLLIILRWLERGEKEEGITIPEHFLQEEESKP